MRRLRATKVVLTGLVVVLALAVAVALLANRKSDASAPHAAVHHLPPVSGAASPKAPGEPTATPSFRTIHQGTLK